MNFWELYNAYDGIFVKGCRAGLSFDECYEICSPKLYIFICPFCTFSLDIYNLLLGLKKPDYGTGIIFGLDPAKNRRAVFKRVGVQLQSSNYQNNIRVDELCKEMSALYEKCEDYRKLLKYFSLEKFEKSQVNKLSGGERQRLSVALGPNT